MAIWIDDDNRPGDRRPPAMDVKGWDRLLLGLEAANRRTPEWRRLRRRRWTRPDRAAAFRRAPSAS